MEYCMENLGNYYKDSEQVFDFEYKFFDSYLKKYLDTQIKDSLVLASKEDNSKFYAYKEEYNISKDRLAKNKNETEALADSYAFYISNATIKIINGKHYINLSKLEILAKSYSEFIEKGTTKKMGTR